MIPSRLRYAFLLAPAVLAGAGASSAAACPEGRGIRAALCGDGATAEILLLPEEAAALDAALPAGTVTVTGAYTGGERAPGAPKPVGVFIAKGRRISLELARMDGLLVVEDGRPRIYTTGEAAVGGARFDLGPYAGRAAFAKAAEAAGASALQSHLLIRDGSLDLSPVEGAPLARRRVLFETASGEVALWESRGAETLYDAAAELLAAHAPVMALNLDMGGHDFCEKLLEGGARAPCGIVPREEAGKLSNVIRLRPAAPGAGG